MAAYPWQRLGKINWFQKKWGRRCIVFLALLFLFFGVRFLFYGDGENKVDFLIVYDPNWSSVNLDGQEKGLVGFSEDLLSMMAKREGVSLHVVKSYSKDVIDLLDGPTVDGVVTLHSPDLVLLDRYIFSDPYYQMGLVLVVNKGEISHSLQQMEGKTVGVLRASPALFYIPQFEKRGQFVIYDSHTAVLDDLVNRKIDGVLMGFIQANAMAEGFFHGEIEIATPPLTQEGLRLVVKRTPNGQRLISTFNQGLISLEKEGIYNQLLDKWSLYRPLSPKKRERRSSGL